jgi:hypothetical protein
MTVVIASRKRGFAFGRAAQRVNRATWLGG